MLLMVQRYKKIEKQRDFKAPQALSGDTELTARAANVLNSVAKVQKNSEISKKKGTKQWLKLSLTVPPIEHHPERQPLRLLKVHLLKPFHQDCHGQLLCA